MPDDKPKYLDDQPRERSGVYMIVAISLVLAVALVGAWKLYIGTVEGWQRRFSPSRDSAVPPSYVQATSATDAVLAEQRLRDLAAARNARPALNVDRCIDGVAFRKLPDGGWENIPNIRCNPN